jgi:hypothetical protein
VVRVEWPDIESNFSNDSMCTRQLGLEDLLERIKRSSRCIRFRRAWSLLRRTRSKLPQYRKSFRSSVELDIPENFKAT